ncbi:replication/maintenance protein RepL [Streptomyces sp. NPDC018352]|uniref:replication/maintenance protein RepL n=1 Tax=Streptomyces sp. NPDC018352 TaxID=3157194 RepID=UPI0034007431
MGEPARRSRRTSAVPPDRPQPRLRPARTDDVNDIARLVAERFGGQKRPPHGFDITAKLRRREAHDMLGGDGYSLISNYFARKVLPYCLMHKIISPMQTAVLSNFIGRQNRGLITATQQEVADEIGVARQSVGPAVDRLCNLNLVRQVKRKVYELNPRIAFNGNGDEQNAFLEQLRALKLETEFPDELAPELTLFPMSDAV